jgi:hypothetical protein
LRKFIGPFVLFFLCVLPGYAEEASDGNSESNSLPQVLVLGVYHMANPGRDVVNMQADDVLAETRQSEIAEVIEVLRGFNPTRIAVEAPFYDSDVISARFRDYVNGEHELSRNETGLNPAEN